MQRLLPWRPRKCALLALSCVTATSQAFGFLTTSLAPSASSQNEPGICPASSAAAPASRLHSTSPESSSSSSSSSSSASSGTMAGTAGNYEVAVFPCLSDNYGFLLHAAATGETAAVDTPDAAAYRRALEARGWKLTHILNTHHHHDHTGGNRELKTAGVTVYGPAREADRIPSLDVGLAGGDAFTFGGMPCRVIDVGGHTRGHVAYHFPDQRVCFVGDSLFSLGCGRMFEGTPQQFWDSLRRLRGLPDDTAIYCAHEYTESNGKFAVSVEPGNADLQARIQQVKQLRAKGEPTIPTSVGEEKKTNPFLRVDVSDEIRANCGVTPGDSDADAFALVRKAKDRF